MPARITGFLAFAFRFVLEKRRSVCFRDREEDEEEAEATEDRKNPVDPSKVMGQRWND